MTCHPCDRCAAILARLDAFLEHAAPSQPELLDVLAKTYGDGWFTAHEVCELAHDQAAAAEAQGTDEPELPATLRRAGIKFHNAYALGRKLPKYEGKGLERGGEDREGARWQVSNFVRSRNR